MAQSKITISTTEYSIKVASFTDKYEPILTENLTVPDPADYQASNSVLVANGNKRHTFNIQGYCDASDRASFISAMKASSKLYPEIYPCGSATNVIETAAWYYIVGFGGNFINGSKSYWFSMDLVQGG